jgi:purine-nucleoside phosphorylase
VTERSDTLRDWHADIAIVLGSGLNSIAKNVIEKIAYSEFAEIPKPGVPGHRGEFSLCQVASVRVIFAQGRVHLYERRTAGEVASIVRILARAGVKRLILTNAAGALNKELKPGDWMMITDHLNLTGTSPLIGTPNFLDMSRCYSVALHKVFASAARRIRLQLRQGVYAGVTGPQYETPAEVRMLQRLGADAVGMSTVLEAIQARALGLEVAAFSCITNRAAGISRAKLSHEEVLAIGTRSAADFSRLLAKAWPALWRACSYQTPPLDR